MTHSKTDKALPHTGTQTDEASEDGGTEWMDEVSRPSSEMSTLPVQGRADPKAGVTRACSRGLRNPAGSPAERDTHWLMTPDADHVPSGPPRGVHAASETADGQSERISTGFRQRRRENGKEAFIRTAELEHDTTLDTDQGLMMQSSNVRAASGAANKKGKRRATATNRPHQGRNRNERNMSINLAQPDQQQTDENAAEPKYRQLAPPGFF